MFGLSSGAFVDANFFNGSTYNNISKTGFSVGLGFRAIKHFTGDDIDAPFAFVSPTIRVGLIKTRSLLKDQNLALNLNIGIPWQLSGVPDSFENREKRMNSNLGLSLRFRLAK